MLAPTTCLWKSRNILSGFFPPWGTRSRGNLQTKPKRKATEQSSRQRSHENCCWKLFLYFFGVKVRRKQYGLFIANQTSHPSVHHRWQTRVHTKDRGLNCWPLLPWIWCICHECFALLIECSFSFHIHALNMTTSLPPPILLKISLRPNTTPHLIRPLLRTVWQDTQVIKSRLILRPDHKSLLRNSITINALQCLV